MYTRVFRRAALVAAVLLNFGLASAQEAGDARQLLSYGVSEGSAPDVSDGQIASVLNPTDWQAAYVRVVEVGVDGDPAQDARPMTLLIANSLDTLYIAAAVELPNSSQQNRLTLYFDQGIAGSLEGSAGTPGEYFVTSLADGSSPSDGHWNGSAWVANTATAVEGVGNRKGTSGADRLFNFEFKMPLSRLADGSNSFLDLTAGEEVGILPRVQMNTGANYYWTETNSDPTDPSPSLPGDATSWAQVRTIGAGIADRNLVSLGALGILPAIDGDIDGDPNWRFGFHKNIVLSDFAGNTIDATLHLKEQSGPDNLILGISLGGVTPSAADHFAVYLDDGASGGDRDFVLTQGGDPTSDNAARVTGSGVFQDYHFDSNDWVSDAVSHGIGAASVSGAGNWDVEMSVPFSSGDTQDMGIATEDELGALFEYRDAATGASYFWSATINDTRRIIDPVDPIHNALGWGFLQTGGPFIQPIYPEDGDVLSGEYPLAVYAVDPGDATPALGIESITYDVRQLDPLSGTFTSLLSGPMTKVNDPGIAIWTATLNTAAINATPAEPLVLVYVVSDGEVDPVSVPIDIFVDNSSSIVNLDDPTVTIDAPAGSSVVFGTVQIEYSAGTDTLLTLDTVELLIDGNVVVTQVSDTAPTFAGTFSWDTSSYGDGEHIIQARASNSLGFENVSPAVLVVVDNGPPEISAVEAVYPDGQSAASDGQTVLVTALVSDAGAGLDAPTVLLRAPQVDPASAAGIVMLDDGTDPDAVAGDNVYSAVVTVTSGNSGTEAYSVEAADVLGNSTLVDGTLELDNTAPTFGSVSVLDPDNIYANGETVSLEASFDAPGYAVTADFSAFDDAFVSGSESVEDLGDGRYRIRYSVSPSNGLTNGMYSVTVTATDGVGLTASGSVELALDNSGAVVSALALDDPDDILNADDAISATVQDEDNAIQAAEFFLDAMGVPGEGTPMSAVDGSFDSPSENVTAALPIGSLDEGQHTVFVRAQDVTGHWGPASSLDFVVDRVAPSIQDVAVAYPVDQTEARDSQTVLFTALVTDATAGLAEARLSAPDANATVVDAPMFDDGTNGDEIAGDDVYSLAIEVTSGNSGEFAFTVTADDVVPNTRSISGSFSLDNEAPVGIDVAVTDPDNIYANGETVSMLVTFDAAGYDVKAHFILVDDSYVVGTEDVEDNGDGTYSIRYTISTTNGVANGTYGVLITATDAVGLEGYESVALVLDNSGARVSALDLSDVDNILNADDVIVATVIDDENVLQAAEYYVDVVGLPGEGNPMAAVDGAFDSMQEDVTAPLSIDDLDEGQHTVFVRAQDVTGQWGPPTGLDFVVDRIPPAIQVVGVTYPDNQTRARDSQTVVFTALVTDVTTEVAGVHLTATDVNASIADAPMFDDGTNGDVVANDDVYSLAVEVTSGNTGDFVFTVAADDIVPNSDSVSGMVSLDNQAPTFSELVVLDPDNIYSNGETISLLATFDAAGYRVTGDFRPIDDTYVTGSEDVQDQQNGSYQVRYTISPSNARPNGTYTVTVTATDSVGLAVTGSVDLVLDNSGAVVIALDLDDEDLILNTDAVILATVEDDDNIIQAAEYYVDVVGLPGEGVAMSPVDGAFDSLVEDVSAPLSIAALDEGQHTVFVRAQDVTGVWGPPQGLDFVVDRIPPAIQVVEVTYPKNQTRARDTQTLLFSALVTDATAGLNTDLVLLTVPDVNEDVVNARMHDDGTNGDFVAGDDVYTLAVEVTSGETGEFSFTIGATDIVPNSSSREGKVLLDNEVPELAVQVAPVPKNGEGLTGEVYQSEVILSGEYRDHPDADFLSVIAIQVRNSAGIDVNNSPFLLPPAEDRAFSRVLSLVEGLNAVTVAVFDGVGNVTTETFELTYIPPKETEIVDSSGGTVTAPDGTSVEIPAKALLEPEEISVRRIRTADLPKPVDDDVEVLANAHRFGPEGIVFHKPVTITLAYSDADLDTDQDGNPDFDESALSAFFWDGFTWIKIEADDRSTSENYVQFMTNHFSIYALGVDSAPDDFEMYWTRNPFAVTEGTTAVMKLPSSGQISLKVYDLEGDLVRTISELEQISGTTNRSWDGTNDFDAYVGSGIYIYLFEYVDGSGVKKVIRKPIGVVE